MYESLNPLAPTDAELSAHYGYIYEIRGPGGRLYVGQHRHRRLEPWPSYTGSGLTLRLEQAWLEPDAFVSLRVPRELLTRRADVNLRYYRKRWLAFADSPAELDTLEADAIAKLVASGRPTYNLEGMPRDSRARIVLDLSFERSLPALISARHSLQRFTPMLSVGGFDEVMEMLHEAQALQDNRRAFINGNRDGLRF